MNTQDVQLLFADLQPALVAGSQTVEPERLSLAAGVLAKAGSILGLPMTFQSLNTGTLP